MGEPAPPPWETDERETYRVRVDADPDAYQRTRPVAPAELFDEAVRLAGLAPGDRVVEIGPGTGQATRPLAERGLRVLALEIGAGLADRTRRNLADLDIVEVRHTSFEAWEPAGERFDAVTACNSFHWIDHDVRFAKPAAVLRPGGHLVLLSTPVAIADDADRFWWDVQDDWVAVGAERIDPLVSHPDRHDAWVPQLRASGLFEDPAVVRLPFAITFTADVYVANLATQTGIKTLPAIAQAELLARIRRRVLDLGGTIAVPHLGLATVARVRPSG